MKIRLKHQTTGVIKDCKIGFSWTTFFFGLWVCVFRQDWKHALIQLGLGALTLGFSWLVFPFIINKMYIRSLMEKGYIPANDSDRNALVNARIISAE